MSVAVHTPDGKRYAGVSLSEKSRGSTDYNLVFNGPEGGEMVVEFDRVRYDDRRVVFTTVGRADRREYERKVFAAEHWGQWGEVSRWIEQHGIEDIPRRFK